MKRSANYFMHFLNNELNQLNQYNQYAASPLGPPKLELKTPEKDKVEVKIPMINIFQEYSLRVLSSAHLHHIHGEPPCYCGLAIPGTARLKNEEHF